MIRCDLTDRVGHSQPARLCVRSIARSPQFVNSHIRWLPLIRQHVQQESHDARIAEPLKVHRSAELRTTSGGQMQSGANILAVACEVVLEAAAKDEQAFVLAGVEWVRRA